MLRGHYVLNRNPGSTESATLTIRVRNELVGLDHPLEFNLRDENVVNAILLRAPRASSRIRYGLDKEAPVVLN